MIRPEFLKNFKHCLINIPPMITISFVYLYKVTKIRILVSICIIHNQTISPANYQKKKKKNRQNRTSGAIEKWGQIQIDDRNRIWLVRRLNSRLVARLRFVVFKEPEFPNYICPRIGQNRSMLSNYKVKRNMIFFYQLFFPRRAPETLLNRIKYFQSKIMGLLYFAW